MWKALSRSVCEVVERRVGVTAIQNDVPNRKKPDSTNCKKICQGQLSCYIPRLKTIYHERLKSIWSRENIRVHSGEKQQDENKNHARWTDTPINACTMGWSTVLILAWYLCQPLGRRLFGDSYYLEIQQHSPPYFSFGNAVHAQSPIQPLTIHPLSYSSSIQDKASETNSFNSSLTSSSSDDVNDFFTHERGPFTPEEALNEVTRVFHEASRTLSGDVENRLGMDCMSKGQHTEAMKHFRRASHHKHAVAAYNMGQCYELGLGTVRSLSKAAKWYKISSDRGHPTAMYNLAVFLANGWGGLQEDTRRARELLIMASSLGLKQAEIALKSIDGDFYVYNSNSNSQEMERKSSTDKFLEMIGGLSNKESEKSGDVKFQQTRTYLSHLDLSVLSSPLSPNSSEVSSGFGETYSFPGSDSCILSSDSVEGVKCDNHESSDSLLFVVDSNESISSGMESLDEASNCGVFTRPL